MTTNSSACSTGTEARASERAAHPPRPRASACCAAASEGASHYIWAGFDAMRVLARGCERRARAGLAADERRAPAGFVPGAGAGVLMLESLDSARARGARIYAELLGGAVNCGGHRGGGSMTAPNPRACARCIRAALATRRSTPDARRRHQRPPDGDRRRPARGRARGRPPSSGTPATFPLITATKSMIGHALGAAGAIECVATVLMLQRGFVHPSLNCEDVHPRDRAVRGVDRRTRRARCRRCSVSPRRASVSATSMPACVFRASWNDG